jgi:hypothetical protein
MTDARDNPLEGSGLPRQLDRAELEVRDIVRKQGSLLKGRGHGDGDGVWE